MALVFATHMTSPLGWLHSLLVAKLGRYSMFLGSLTSWSLHCIFGFALTASHTTPSWASYRDSDSVCYTLRGFSGFPLKSEWNLPGTHKFCILHAWKISIMWVTSFATSSSSSWAPEDHSCSSIFVPERLTAKKESWGNNFLSSPQRRVPQQCSLLKGKSFKW
jgi:hypothetical protein